MLHVLSPSVLARRSAAAVPRFIYRVTLQKRRGVYYYVMKLFSKLSYQIVFLLVTYGFGIAFFFLIDPRTLPLVLMIVPFLWVFIAIFFTCWVIMSHFEVFGSRKRRVILGGVASGLPVLLLVLSSIHQLTFRDVVISVAIVSLLGLYMSRADFLR